ncbi:MAG: glycoside hydrolase family 10 protein [Acutalibacteraceae bacterium]|nr:family 10 glycosylhydrolase [Oscillospiraceae bacterium]
MKKLLPLISILTAAILLLSGCSVGSAGGDNSGYAPVSGNTEPDTTAGTTAKRADPVPANDNIIAGSAQATAVETAASQSAAVPSAGTGEFRAMWIAAYELAPDSAASSRKKYKKKTDAMMKNLLTLGVTDVFAQVRANCDSIYPSEYFKPHSGFQKNGMLAFDALKILVSSAHEHGIRLHAWINPYRISAENGVSDDDPIFRFVKKSDIYQSSGKAYLKPVSERAKRLVLKGVREILSYDVDGIHIDDYFYPTGDEKIDSAEYEEYKSGGGALSLSDWRRAHVSSLVSSIYSLVKSSGQSRIFSISPGGDIDKNQNYLYADVKLWCSTPGYADLIIPQIYFGFQNEHLPFRKCLDDWEKIVTCDSVSLAVGLAAYKSDKSDEYAGTGEHEWEREHDIIKREVEYLRTKKCIGFSLFSYHHIFSDNNLINTEIQNLKSVL